MFLFNDTEKKLLDFFALYLKIEPMYKIEMMLVASL